MFAVEGCRAVPGLTGPDRQPNRQMGFSAGLCTLDEDTVARYRRVLGDDHSHTRPGLTTFVDLLALCET